MRTARAAIGVGKSRSPPSLSPSADQHGHTGLPRCWKGASSFAPEMQRRWSEPVTRPWPPHPPRAIIRGRLLNCGESAGLARHAATAQQSTVVPCVDWPSGSSPFGFQPTGLYLNPPNPTSRGNLLAPRAEMKERAKISAPCSRDEGNRLPSGCRARRHSTPVGHQDRRAVP
jgi:hypothetical protein